MSQYDSVKRAAALKYSTTDNTVAPIVVASGLGFTAQKIVEIAQEHNVPIFQDDSLASLLSQLDVGAPIPPELYKAIVDIYVYFLNFTLSDKGENDVKESDNTRKTNNEVLQGDSNTIAELKLAAAKGRESSKISSVNLKEFV